MKITVIGAGIMGTGIALHFLRNQHEVVLYDISDNALYQAERYIKEISRIEGEKYKLSLAGNLEESIVDSEIIFEAIIEDLNAKRKLYNKILSIKNNIPIASNTSTFTVRQLVDGLLNKDNILIAHWMNPPDIIPVVEVAKGPDTKQQYKDIVVNLLKNTGKIVVEVPDIPGLIVNRINKAIYREALKLHFIYGISIETIDTIMKYHLGIIYSTTGIFKTIDYIGLDTFLKSAQSLAGEGYTEEDLKIANQLLKMINENKIGIKTGEGFYHYHSKSLFSHLIERNHKLKEVLECLKDMRL